MTAARILVVDDDPSMQRVLKAALSDAGYRVDIAGTGSDADRLLEDGVPDLAILDLNLPDGSGLDYLAGWRARGLEFPIVVLTAQNTVENAIRAMQLGAFDYVTKPFDLDELDELLAKALVVEGGPDREPDEDAVPAEDVRRTRLVGTSAQMQEVYKTIGKTAGTDATTLLIGESGTGKELVARAIHEFSPRAKGPFVAVNMTAIPSDLLEAELFGYEKGAFTGATQATLGKFREADGGTLLLDEIGDMPLALQGKLLRVLQEKEITPLGGRRPIPIDVRIIAATQVPLDDAIQQGQFRADLYYRIKVVEIDLPPLRDRIEDIPSLCDLFLQRMREREEIPPKHIAEDAHALLQTASWPGNVRQLENLVRRVALLSPRRELGAEAFRQFGGEFAATEPDQEFAGFSRIVEQNLRTYVKAMHEVGDSDVWAAVIGSVEKVLLTLALEACGGNQLRASELLGINRNTMRKKLTENNIDPRLFKQG